jgi:hypothetical protein
VKERDLLEPGLEALEANFQVSCTKSQILTYIEENRQALTNRSDLESCKLVINRFVEKIIITLKDAHPKYRFGVDVDNGDSPEPHLTLSESVSRQIIYSNLVRTPG